MMISISLKRLDVIVLGVMSVGSSDNILSHKVIDVRGSCGGY